MKSTFVLTAAGAALLVSASIASAQQQTHGAPPSARAIMQQNANDSAQSTTDMSYGGVVDTYGDTGAANGPPSPAAGTVPTSDKSAKPATQQTPSHW
jgi:hypothetical protein